MRVTRYRYQCLTGFFASTFVSILTVWVSAKPGSTDVCSSRTTHERTLQGSSRAAPIGFLIHSLFGLVHPRWFSTNGIPFCFSFMSRSSAAQDLVSRYPRYNKGPLGSSSSPHLGFVECSTRYCPGGLAGQRRPPNSKGRSWGDLRTGTLPTAHPIRRAITVGTKGTLPTAHP